MSFPDGRHFFVEDGVLMLTVAKAVLQGGGQGVLEHPVRSLIIIAVGCHAVVPIRSPRNETGPVRSWHPLDVILM